MTSLTTTRKHEYLVATELNNIGVQLLEAGSLRRALQTLKEAIEVMKIALRPATVETSSENRLCGVPSFSAFVDTRLFKAKRRLEELELPHAPPRNVLIFKTGEGFHDASSSMDDTIETTFSDPILIEVSANHVQALDHSNPDLESAIVFYNLALVHQRMSTHVRNGSIFVQGAHDLFDMAYSIALSEETHTIMTMSLDDIRGLNETRVFLAIILLNNLIRVKQVMGKHEEANNAMQRLIRLGMAVNDPEAEVEYLNASRAAAAA